MHAGRERAKAREAAKKKHIDTLYANTPVLPESRQVRRKRERQASKA